MTSTLTAFEQRLLTQITLQEAINQRIHPEWRAAKNHWFRAIWTECAEMLDHIGWKWWKKKQPNTQQVHLEIVDIWHFGLSDLLQRELNTTRLAQEIAAVFLAPPKIISQQEGEPTLLTYVENLATKALADKAFCLSTFNQLLIAADFSHEALFKQYVGKNILNGFRQARGYLDGSYRKTWHDQREDNEHLSELLDSLEIQDANFALRLEEALDERYRQCC